MDQEALKLKPFTIVLQVEIIGGAQSTEQQVKAALTHAVEDVRNQYVLKVHYEPAPSSTMTSLFITIGVTVTAFDLDQAEERAKDTLGAAIRPTRLDYNLIIRRDTGQSRAPIPSC